MSVCVRVGAIAADTRVASAILPLRGCEGESDDGLCECMRKFEGERECVSVRARA